MDSEFDRMTDEDDVIDTTGIDPTVLHDLPDSALAAALRRATNEYADDAEHYARWQDGPPLPPSSR